MVIEKLRPDTDDGDQLRDGDDAGSTYRGASEALYGSSAVCCPEGTAENPAL